MPNCSYPRRESSLLLVLLSCGLALSLLAPTQSWAQLTHYSFIELVDGQVSDRFSVRIPVPAGREALLTSASFEVISAQAFAKTDTAAATSPLPADVKFAVTNSAVGFAARRPELVVDLNVERSSGRGNLFVLGRYTYTETPGSLQPRTGPNEPTTSVLAEGRIVKVAVGDDGIYAIDAALLKSLGLSQTGGPSAVRVFTKGGAMLPERVGAAYPIDLLEVALLEQGNGDANWNAGERLLFYGEGEDVWAWDSLRRAFDRTENLYAEETYYYLKVEGVGLRVAVDPELLSLIHI